MMGAGSGASKTSGVINRNGYYTEEVEVEDMGVTSKTAVDETESSWNRRSTDRQTTSSAVVGK